MVFPSVVAFDPGLLRLGLFLELLLEPLLPGFERFPTLCRNAVRDGVNTYPTHAPQLPFSGLPPGHTSDIS